MRRERERRGISLDVIVTCTNVSRELWEGFESGDLSRWPSGLYSRAFVRDYAKAVGLDPDEVVDDFCRLFPLADRRALPIIAATAELIGHDTTAADDPRLMPNGVDRRAGPTAARESRPQPVGLARIFKAIFHT
jgi:cytoskeletal protein RodZ